jgi:hypothetical protein
MEGGNAFGLVFHLSYLTASNCSLTETAFVLPEIIPGGGGGGRGGRGGGGLGLGG